MSIKTTVHPPDAIRTDFCATISFPVFHNDHESVPPLRERVRTHQLSNRAFPAHVCHRSMSENPSPVRFFSGSITSVLFGQHLAVSRELQNVMRTRSVARQRHEKIEPHRFTSLDNVACQKERRWDRGGTFAPNMTLEDIERAGLLRDFAQRYGRQQAGGQPICWESIGPGLYSKIIKYNI